MGLADAAPRTEKQEEVPLSSPRGSLTSKLSFSRVRQLSFSRRSRSKSSKDGVQPPTNEANEPYPLNGAEKPSSFKVEMPAEKETTAPAAQEAAAEEAAQAEEGAKSPVAATQASDITHFNVVLPPNAVSGSKLRIKVPGTMEKVVVKVPEGATAGCVVSFPLSRAWVETRVRLRAATKLQAAARAAQARVQARRVRAAKAAAAAARDEAEAAKAAEGAGAVKTAEVAASRAVEEAAANAAEVAKVVHALVQGVVAQVVTKAVREQAEAEAAAVVDSAMAQALQAEAVAAAVVDSAMAQALQDSAVAQPLQEMAAAKEEQAPQVAVTAEEERQVPHDPSPGPHHPQGPHQRIPCYMLCHPYLGPHQWPRVSTIPACFGPHCHSLALTITPGPK